MKKFFKGLSTLTLSLIMIFALSANSYADSSVTYSGGAEKFVFLEGSKYSDSDLFGNFKDVMPGDELSQKITIKNTIRNADTVNIYIRAVIHDEQSNPMSGKVAAETDLAAMQEFLSQLSMTVRQGDKLLFDASPDQLDGLKENVLLGSFPKNSTSELVVTLTVPLELGNEFQNRTGEVDWVFTAEEISSSAPSRPKTGDESNTALWILLILLSSLAAGVLGINIRRKED